MTAERDTELALAIERRAEAASDYCGPRDHYRWNHDREHFRLEYRTFAEWLYEHWRSRLREKIAPGAALDHMAALREGAAGRPGEREA